MSWTKIRAALKEHTAEQLLEVLKGLYDLAPQNKAYLQTQLLPATNADFLEICRRQIVHAIYPPNRRFPDTAPRFAEAKKVIASYAKTTKNVKGKLDLELTYVERGTQFTLDFGDIDAPFYTALENMLGRFTAELQEQSDAVELYQEFETRLRRLANQTNGLGWGYGDTVQDLTHELAVRVGTKVPKTGG